MACMASLLHQIGFPDAVSEAVSSSGLKPDRLSSLATLNVFIGPNNSGKSRCLRALFGAPRFHVIPNAEPWAACYEASQSIRDVSATRFDDLSPEKRNSHLFELLSLPLYSSDCQRYAKSIVNDSKQLLRGGNMPHSVGDQIAKETGVDDPSSRRLAGESISALQRLIRELNQGMPDQAAMVLSCIKSRHYIPSLRSLRRIGDYASPSSDHLANTTKDDYFDGDKGIVAQQGGDHNNDRILYTGERFYSIVRSYLLGSLQQRQAIRDFENFIGDQFFEGQSVTLIPHEEQNHLVLKVGTEEEYPIHSLGDGLQQVIIMTLPMFLHSTKPSLFFVEEPELYLHPGMQRKFIETVLLGQGHEYRQVFVTTHSTQFLDLTLEHTDISVFRFDKTVGSAGQASFEITNTSNEDRQLLLELGVHNSSVLLANCTIWVEGITDRLYLRRFFEIYQAERSRTGSSFAHMLDDTHYSFVEYSGANLAHWSAGTDDDEAIHMDYLCGNALVICDADASGAKRAAHAELRRRIGENAYVLEVREVENLLTPEVLSAVIRDYERNEGLNLRHFTQST